MHIAETIKFRDICVMLQKIKAAPSKEKKVRILQQYYESFCKHRTAFREEHKLGPQTEEDGTSSFYCVLRCIIPGTDSARQPYGLAIPTLGKVYIKVLQLAGDSRDAKRLEASSFSGIHGDYAQIVYSVLRPRCPHRPSNLTLKQIHDMLDSVASENRQNTEKVLTHLSEVASAEEQMWFIRLLLKSMNLAIGEQRVFAVLHPQAKEFYLSCGNLLRLCCCLADNKLDVKALTERGAQSSSAFGRLDLQTVVVPFDHIRPQLCEIFPGNIGNLMAQDVLYMETKMDGERFQLHYADGRFKYISRNGVDYTESFGDSFECEGRLTAKLKHLLPIGMQSIILDGEMMVWDLVNARYREKGENTDVKHLSADRSWQPCFVVYDLLYLNGSQLLHLPYAQRTYKMRGLLKEQQGVLQLMKPQKISSVDEFGRLFQKALDDHQEGVVLKQRNAIYRPGVRNGGGWFKVKADYIEGLTTEFDLLIIGGFYNRQRTFIESFLVGVLKYINAQQYEVWSVGKVSNITRQRLVLHNMLKAHWHHEAQEKPPMWYHYRATNAEGRPDVWIEPRNSTILQIRATDLTPSGAFALSLALHFPRIQAWRNDKLWHECLSLEEYMQLKQSTGRGSSIRKIVKRPLSLEDFTADNTKRRRKLTPAQKRKLGIQSYEQRFDPKSIKQTSDLLQGYSVCILSASLARGYAPEDLKALVVSNGGSVVENPLPNNPECIVVAGDKTYRVQTLCKGHRYDIVSMDWLLRICENQDVQLRPRDMLCITEPLRAKFAELYDEYGDSYTEYVSRSELKSILDEINDDDVPDLSQSYIEELEGELFGNEGPNFFRNCRGCFYSSDLRSLRAKFTFQWRGGVVVSGDLISQGLHESHSIFYIFLNLEQFSKSSFIKWLHEKLVDNLKNLKIVNINWIFESHQSKCLLDVNEYTWHDF